MGTWSLRELDRVLFEILNPGESSVPRLRRPGDAQRSGTGM